MNKINIQFCGAIVASATAVALLQQPSFAQTPGMGLPDGYFATGGSVYARSGGTICGFARPAHLEIYRRVNPAPDIRVTNIRSYRNIGRCSVPAAYFAHGGSVYYSFGDGKFCGFPRPEAYNEYLNYYRVPNVGVISTNPRQFMRYLGICPPPQ